LSCIAVRFGGAGTASLPEFSGLLPRALCRQGRVQDYGQKWAGKTRKSQNSRSFIFH